MCVRAWQWKDGLVSGAVYGGEDDLMELMGQASALYSLTNPLHPDLFPSLMKFEVCQSGRRCGLPELVLRADCCGGVCAYAWIHRICQAEVCSMVANLVNGGDKGVVGALTSGGQKPLHMGPVAPISVWTHPLLACGRRHRGGD
jgi:hypothetical protein